ncbi:type I polyketide synthase [Aquisphaera giovannonii]|nr:type I polyketide synthase [Aquisphaera giovannonii]
MHWNEHRIIVTAPPGLDGAGIVAAASRSGGLGILDGMEPDARDRGRSRMRGLKVAAYAMRIPAAAVVRGDAGMAEAALKAVVLPGGEAEQVLAEACRVVKGGGRGVLVEAASIAEVEAALRAGADGLVAMGEEVGGPSGTESAFILLQAILARTDRPAWVRGGIGPRVAAGCVAAGAAGVVLDGAILLARESPLTPEARARIAGWDGSEAVRIAPAGGRGVRVFAMPTSPALARLREAARVGGEAWTRAAAREVGWGHDQAWPIGQDAAFAGGLSAHATVGGIMREFERAIARGIDGAASARPLAAGSPLARDHGCELPILQGPMTRVSDVAPFAEAVATEGGLPFVALALLRRPAAEALLAETARRLGGRPWGVGLLGFAPADLREEQLEAVRNAKPPFALIAGGRPDQAAGLEKEGIAAYLHVPSPGLLDQYLRSGARRFILEGRECGGHVGPRSSFLLWEQACRVLDEAIASGIDAASLSVVFAGGIHDARSAALVAATAGDLAAKGVRIGVLMGTAYLFTREAVASGAIVERFQREAIRCRGTVLLESGPGHLVRVAPSPFVDAFDEERGRLLARGVPHDEVREALERLNAGRLRIAAKGVDRGDGTGSPLVPVPEERQAADGLYMIGQVAALRGEVTTMRDLHRDVTSGATDRIGRLASARTDEPEAASPAAIAIVGMAALLPGAKDVASFWANSLQGTDAITEVPGDRWDWRPYYDPDPKAPDKIYSKWGGFVPDLPFDPLRYGMPPATLPSMEPAQLLALEVARAALADAGYANRPFAKDRTAVVLGMGGGAAQVSMGYAFRSYLPMLDAVIPGGGAAAMEKCEGLLPEWTEDSFPGFLLNVTAGRIANRLDLGGANYTVDAACGSSLAALTLAVRELRQGAADMVLLGGVDTVQNPFTYLAFSKTQAFSPRGRCRPFDASADGIVISEGVAAVVLKRLEDAERDGDRIYAVIRGVGSSSDGRAKGLTAPNDDGQVRALERAYREAGVDPATVGYVEAHGTGTAVGDAVEIDALGRLLHARGVKAGGCVVGSVKSQIGHTKCAAGLAGLIHATLALKHRVLPPTIGIETPSPRLKQNGGTLRVNVEPQPWIHAAADRPRRAGVSAFGFGGTNFHAVLEAYDDDPASGPEAPTPDWPAELFAWSAGDRASLLLELDRLADRLAAGARPPLRDLSHAVNTRFESAPGGHALALVAESHEDLVARLDVARRAIRSGTRELADPRGIHYKAAPAFPGGKVAFVFPGQGSQAVNMLSELAVHLGEVRGAFDDFDAALVAEGREPIGPRVFPAPAFDDEARAGQAEALRATEVAQPAIGAASVGLLRLLDRLGLRADMAAGHSFGELVALHAAGSIDAKGLATLAEARGRLMREAGGDAPGAMVALMAGPDAVRPLIADLGGTRLVNLNGPRQSVVAGPREEVDRVLERAEARRIRGRRLPVAAAFHTPRMEPARAPLAGEAARRLGKAPSFPVFSNLDAAAHPADPVAIADRLGEHAASPVRFAEMIEAMADQGARVFVEVGPGGVLTSLIGSILGDRPHLGVACESPGRQGLAGLLHALARLAAAGLRPRLGELTRGRCGRVLDLEDLPAGDGSQPLPASTWMVNGSRARPLHAPEPRRLGQAGLTPPAPAPAPHAPPASPAPPRRTPAARPVEPAANGSASNGKMHEGIRTMHAHTNNGGPQAASPSLPESPPPATAAVATPASTPPAEGLPAGAERVMAAFQETMRSFLEVQRTTMLAYLTGRPEPAATVPAPGTAVATPAVAYASPAPPKAAPAPAAPKPAPQPAVRAATRTAPAHAEAREPSPAPAPASPAPPVVGKSGPEPAAAAAGRDEIASKLLDIVRERTGYPLEVLKLELDLEADLGIDSIKRVEILGKLRDAFPGIGGASDPEAMDKLAGARTLAAIVDRVEKSLGRPAVELPPPQAEPTAPAPTVPAPAPSANGKAHGEPRGTPRRLLLEPVPAPLEGGEAGLADGGVVVITPDDRGIAEALEVSIRSRGWKTAVIGGPASRLDWTSQAAIEEVLGRARLAGPLAGLVHLTPLRSARAEELDPAAWSRRMNPEARGLFLLAKGMAGDLEEAAARGGASLIAATAMGGQLASAGVAGEAAGFFPGHGAVSGLIKTIAREWTAVRTRVVDLDAREAPKKLASRLLGELLNEDRWSEVGYNGPRRIRLRSVPSRLAAKAEAAPLLAPGEPVLMTGGARGITSLVAAEMARRWKPTLLLLGTTPLPDGPADAELERLEDPAALKSAIYDRLRRGGRLAGPADLEVAYQSLRRGREVRRSLEALRALGARVEYAQADVRDPARLAGVLDGWRGLFGDPVGLIHGAGLIRDKLLTEKSIESFDRVLGTKLDGALNVVGLLRPERLRFSVFFSSIAGRFGNEGQSDYAAANDALNKLAVWLDRRWPGRVVAPIWGPWAGIGMVSDLADHLASRGLGMIAPKAGVAALMDELTRGRKGDVEVILAGDLGSLEAPIARKAARRLEAVR